MPVLLSRAATPSHLRHLAACRPRLLDAQVRRQHGFATPTHPLLESQPTVQEDGRRVRVRKHGFQSLPMSPLMVKDDAIKNRTSATSDEETLALAQMQKEVAMNPFAHALATPIRSCSLTFARLPSYFLLPFSTTIERSPASEGQLPKIRAHLQPGRRSEHTGETLTQTSYVINRSDMVRHLSRKKHWATLVTDRHKAKVASIVNRSPQSQKLVQDLWIWDNKVDLAAAMMEKKVVAELGRVLKVEDASAESSREPAFAVRFGEDGASVRSETASEVEVQTYDLPTLLSPEALSSLADNAAKETHIISRGPDSWQAQLALEKLKVYKESNEIMKNLPKEPNPPGSREERRKRLMEVEAQPRDEDSDTA